MNVIDKIETLILLSLDADAAVSAVQRREPRYSAEGYWQVGGVDRFLEFKEMIPKSCYTSDLSRTDRIYASRPEYLVRHPAETLGDSAEVVFLDNLGLFCWHGFRRMPALPKGISVLGKPYVCYESHTRVLSTGGAGELGKRIAVLDKRGNLLPAKVGNLPASTTYNATCSPILCAGVIEDAHRSDAMLARVKDATEIKFPVPLDDYKYAFSDRDGPVLKGKRRPILHWVAQHLRGESTVVRKHTRGVSEFTIDGITLSISPNQAP